MSFENIPKNIPETLILARQGPVEYTKEAIDADPTPGADEEGVVLLVTDTGDRYIWTGTDWIQTHIAGKLLVQIAKAATTATLSSAISCGTAASVKVADANSNRKYINIFNSATSAAVWIKLQKASTDNAQKGIYLAAKENKELKGDPMYTGEICVISSSGTRDVFVTEY